MKQRIETAVSICKIAKGDDLNAKKSLCLEIFGSNLQIRQKEVVVNDDQFLNSPQKNRWLALRTASEKAARSGDRFCFNSDFGARGGNRTRTSFGQEILSLSRLPIPPPAQDNYEIYYIQLIVVCKLFY